MPPLKGPGGPPPGNANIYGTDDNSFAEGIAADALRTSDQGNEDYWGGIQDSRAIAKANVGAESTGPTDPDTPTLRSQQDAGNLENEALNMPEDYKGPDFRHRQGPSTSTDEGAGLRFPPPRNQTGKPGKVSGPVYNKKVS